MPVGATPTMNRLIESTDGEGNTTTYRYDQAGCGCTEENLVTGIHTPDLPAGVEWTFEYGPGGRLAKMIDPHGFEETYSYEVTGELRETVDRLSRTSTMTHDQLGRVLAMVDTLGRRHTRTYPVPTAGAWSGPGLTAASADGTAAATSLTAAMRSGDYQIGKNAFDTEGHPARISLYRDATIDVSYAHAFDSAARLLNRVSRDGRPSSDPTFQPSLLPVGLANEVHSWNGFTATPLLAFSDSTASTFENQGLSLQRNFEFDVTLEDGFTGGAERAARYAYTRDAGGRLTAMARRYTTGALTIPGTPSPVFPPGSTYTCRPDGRIGQMTGPDGTHDFTYDARGLMATRTVAGEGTYVYAYDAVGRNTRITFPDGHERVQVFDDLGRITSRCYDYSAVPGAATRCYTAMYDPVGNPVRMTDPEGADVLTYDALDRLTSVTREEGGGPVSSEVYAFNAMGALSINAGVAMDHQRPRLDGGGLADSAVPASLGGLPINLDAAGRITSLRGVSLGYSGRGYLIEANPPVPEVSTHILVDAEMRRVLKATADGPEVHWYVYEGMDRVARLDRFGSVVESTLFDGIDHPLRVNRGGVRVFYELDLAGNVRRLRGVGGMDLGGYRFSAFGVQVEDSASGSFEQDLRWKGRPRDALGGGLEAYDMRAREWVPGAGAFVAVDEYAFHNEHTTLWSWPTQNALRFSDPTGRLPWWFPLPPPKPPSPCPRKDDVEAHGELERCQQHAGDDPDGWADYCGTIPRLKRRSCLSHTFSNSTERSNWCYWHFGPG